ncbi:MAG TPA: hypothetical protein ENJ11_09380 [Gammaproteobacteria bacterium]|nr:hypothetical protein [Gammaproteobacteria bacterium]
MFAEEVVISDVSLDVSTDNYEEFDQEIQPALLGESLEQNNTLKGSHRRFQFYRSNYLLLDITDKKNAPEKKFHLNLAWLSAEPEHHKHIVWKWLVSSLTALLATGLFFYLYYAQILPAIYGLTGGVLSLSGSLIFALIFIYQMRDEYVFYSYYAHVRLFLMENKKPDPTGFDDFFIKLQQRIEKARAGMPVAQRLVGELKMCRRLKDENIIDEESYTQARGIIFKHEQYQA